MLSLLPELSLSTSQRGRASRHNTSEQEVLRNQSRRE